MSHPTPTSSFQLVFEIALQDYEKQTGTKLIDHPLARQLETCESVESITIFFEQQVRACNEFRGGSGKVIKSLKCAVHVLYMLSTSAALGEGIGLVRCKAPRGFPSFDADTAISPGEGNVRCFRCSNRSTFPTFPLPLSTISERLFARLSRMLVRATILSSTSSSRSEVSSNGSTFIPKSLSPRS